MNPHKDCELRKIWFQKGEYKKLTDALNEGRNDDVLDILFEIYKRGDL